MCSSDLGSVASKACPIIFGRPFLNTCGAIIDCKKGKIYTKFNGESYEFNFSKFGKQLYETDLPNEDSKIEQLAAIAIAPNNALQQFMEEHESEVFMEERNEIDNAFLRQPPILKHNLPVEDLGTSAPPKEDPVFDLKPLPDNLKYVYLDEKKVYPIAPRCFLNTSNNLASSVPESLELIITGYVFLSSI